MKFFLINHSEGSVSFFLNINTLNTLMPQILKFFYILRFLYEKQLKNCHIFYILWSEKVDGHLFSVIKIH